MPADKSMPSTVKRSSSQAPGTWLETHDNAVDEYGEGERAHRTAFAALKHTHEKVRDHWEPKGHKGPSDPQAARTGTAAKRGAGESHDGVDMMGRSKDDLMRTAQKLGIDVRSKMNKSELAEAINKSNKRATANARRK